MTFHLKRLKSNMLRAVFDATVLLIGITVPVAKVMPPILASVVELSVPGVGDGPSGKIMG